MGGWVGEIKYLRGNLKYLRDAQNFKRNLASRRRASSLNAAGVNFAVLNAVLNICFCISESSNLKFSSAAPLTLARTDIYGTNHLVHWANGGGISCSRQ